MGPHLRLPSRAASPRRADYEPLPQSEDEFKTKPSAFGPARFAIILICVVLLYLRSPILSRSWSWSSASETLPSYIRKGVGQCDIIARPPPNPQPYNHERRESDRYVQGTGDVLLKNATLWTGDQDGQEILRGADVLLSKGVIRFIGDSARLGSDVIKHADVVNLDGSWVTPGIVDMHSHIGVEPAPINLKGTVDDGNSAKGPVLPWLRSLDSFNTHDQAFNLTIAGGVTTALVLPGSAGNIGGQAFTFKLRATAENTPQSMQVDPPFRIVKHGNETRWERTGAWRHIKHAVGENPHDVYQNNRMDSAFDFRRAYTQGLELKEKQDRWCEDPKSQKEPFPMSLEWEALADVIRGNVKVNIHCYEATDVNSMVRISNEFKFPIAAFHHAHETYLVPDLLKQAWGSPPGVALFAIMGRYKREAFRGSEYAPAILAKEGIRVSMKSDHPGAVDSRYLVNEAAQAHYYGLNASHALASVTSRSAEQIGLGHRLGYIRLGYDADVVVWDSYPLVLGATPKQVYIDGIPQLIHPHNIDKPDEAQHVSQPGNWSTELAETLASRGEPDLWPKRSTSSVVFANVRELYRRDGASVRLEGDGNGVVVVQDGVIVCAGACQLGGGYETVDLKGGSITPGLLTVGSAVGNVVMDQELSTQDGIVLDPAGSNSPLVNGLLDHAINGISFGSPDALYGYRSGVTLMSVIPQSDALFLGLSAVASTGAHHSLQKGAIINPKAALHISLMQNDKQAISTRFAILRRLLTTDANKDTEIWKCMQDVKTGAKRLVVHVNKADTMAALVRLKREVAPDMKVTLLGGTESWMIAEDLAAEDIGVVVAPARSFPIDWDSRRIIPGPPLSNLTLPAFLKSRGVRVGLGVPYGTGLTYNWSVRNTRVEAAWAHTANPGIFSKAEALDLVGKNLEEMLGVYEDGADGVPGGNDFAYGHGDASSWVAWEGDWAGYGGRVKAVKAIGAARVDIL